MAAFMKTDPLNSKNVMVEGTKTQPKDEAALYLKKNYKFTSFARLFYDEK